MPDTNPTVNPLWDEKTQHTLYMSMIIRAQKDPAFAAACTDTPETARKAAREEAARIAPGREHPRESSSGRCPTSTSSAWFPRRG